MGRIFVEVVRRGKRGLQALPDPPGGQGYLVVPVENRLLDRINSLDGMGHFDRELSELLSRTVQQFFQTRPVSISTPGPRIKHGSGLRLHDPRDPDKHPLN